LPVGLDTTYSVAIIVTLWATALGSGLSHQPSEIAAAASDRGRFVRIIALDAVAIPLLVFALARALAVPQGYVAGLVIVGAASAGTLGLAFVRSARADVPLAIGLVVVLEIGNLLTIPAWSTILLAEGVRPPVGDVLGTLVLGVLVPLVIGIELRKLQPERAREWARVLGFVSTLGLAVVVAIVLYRDLDAVIEAWAALVPVVALATALIAVAAGWTLGGPVRSSRATAGLVTSVRANTPALAVAGGIYGARSDAALAIVVFALVAIAVSSLVAMWVRRSAAARAL
jgi:bile acid:Na+ symporter, BASS family